MKTVAAKRATKVARIKAAKGQAPLATPAEAFDGAIVKSADWVEVVHAVVGDSRSLTESERAALDEFTWAELRS